MFKFLTQINSKTIKGLNKWRTKSPCLFAFFLVGIGFIGIIGILCSSFVTLVPHTRSRCKYANRRNSHQIVKRSLVQLSPFPWIQQLLLSNIHCASIAVYHLVMERVRLLAATLQKIDLNLILKVSQLLGCITSCWTHLIWFWQNEVA